MTELNIAIPFNDAELLAKISHHVNRSTDHLLNRAFSNDHAGKNGFAYQVISEKIDDLLCADSTKKVVEQLVSEHWNRLLQEAVLKALEHKANRVAFTQVKAKLPIEGN